MRALAIGMLVVLVTVVRAAEDEPPTELTADDRALIASALAAGLPDPGGCTFWTGAVRGEAPSGRRSELGWPQLHLRFPDGHWLLHGIVYHDPAEPIVVLADGASAVGAGRVALDQETRLSIALSVYATLVGAALDERTSISLSYGFVVDEGWTRPARLEVCGRRHGEPPRRVDTSRRLPRHEKLRRELHRLALTMATRAPRAQRQPLLAAAAALLAPDERPVRLPAIERLATLPDEDSAGDRIGSALRSWTPEVSWYPRFGRYADEAGAQDEPAPWRDGDADALVAALASAEPARQITHPDETPRTVGDLALQALAWLWGVDPRLLVGRDPLAPWTDAERAGSATAIQSWWSAHRAPHFAAALLSDPAHADLLWRAQVSTAARPEDLPALAQGVAELWRALPSSAREAIAEDDVADVLTALRDQQALANEVRSWPCVGAHRWNLALEHERSGDQAPLTALLRELLAGPPPAALPSWRLASWFDSPPVDPACDRGLAAAYLAGIRSPTIDRCRLLAESLRAPVGSWAWNVAHQLAIFGHGLPTWPRHDLAIGFLASDGGTDLPLVLAVLALADTRPLQPAFQVHNPRIISDTPPGDPTMRVCDEVALALAHVRPRDRDTPLVPPGWSLPHDPAERPAAIAELAEWLLPRAATARAALAWDIELPFLGPRPPPFPEWWQRELDAAASAGVPIMLLFTDTRTCAPCRRLERAVLSRSEWTTWAASHLRLVILDGAGHEADAEFAARWLALGEIYRARGIPGLRLVAADGHELTSAARGGLIDTGATSPTAFIAGIEAVIAADASGR